MNEFEAQTKKIKFKNTETGLIRTFTINEMIKDINRDRSEDWQDYDLTDWQEGMEQFTEWELFEELKAESEI